MRRACALTIRNATRTEPIPTRRMVELADIIFRGERRSGTVDVVLIGDARMRKLNQAFRLEDKTTDVLSFSLEDDEGDQPNPYLGEIYISIPQAKRQALRAEHELNDEILFLLSHGLLHLLGKTHETQSRFNRMLDIQVKYLNKLYKKK